MQTTGLYGKILSNTFNSATTAYAQKVKPRVIIDLLDSRHLDNLTVTTNSAHGNTSKGSYGYYFSPNQLVNGVERQSFTWAVTGAKDNRGQVIKADGNWHCMPSSIDRGYEFGWSSASVSNANTHATYSSEYGFATDPYVEIQFTQRKVNKIRIITSEFSGQIGHYTVVAYNQTYSAVLNEVGYIQPGTYYQDHWISPAVASQDIYRIRVTVHTTKNKQDYARIQEICPIYEYDITNYVIDSSLDRVRDIHESSLPIAGSGSSTLSINFDNTEKDFNLFNSNSTFGKYMKKDLKIHVYYGWRIKKTEDILSNTILKANIDSSAGTIIVDDTNIFPDGGENNYYTIFIDKDTQSEEIVLISQKTDDKNLQVSQRGYGGTTAKSHTTGATVTFDPYEYVFFGTFYVDEWSATSSSMTASVSAADWTKFMNEKTIENGFFMQNVTVGKAVENLLMETNFPKADYKYLKKFEDGAKLNNAILHMAFNEPTVDRSGNNIVPAAGLRARFWAMPENNYAGVKDILADAIDKQLSPLDLAQGLKPFVSPTYNALTKDISTAGYSVDISNYSFTVGSDTYTEYFNGVFDGYYIPKNGGTQEIVIYIKFGGVRVYLDDTLIIDEWLMHPTSGGSLTRIGSSDYLGYDLNLDAGVPYKIRIEFFHSYGSSGNDLFSIELAKSVNGAADETILDTECTTIVAFDSIGSRNAGFASGVKNRNHHRNNGIYINTPVLGSPTGLVSDPNNKSVSLQNNSYIRIPNDVSWRLANTSSTNYTNEFTIEAYVKFNNGVFASDGEYISCLSLTSGFALYANSSGHGFKLNVSSYTANIFTNTALSTTEFTHIVATNKDGNIKYYVNGELKASDNAGSGKTNWLSDITIGGKGASFVNGSGESPPATFTPFIIDEFAIYNRELTEEQIKTRYTETQMQPITVFPFLYGNNETIKNIADTITLADFGRLFIDEQNYAKYEHFYRFFETSIDQHANVQASISGDSNIISADYAVQLQTNKVTVKVAGLASVVNGTQSLWRANDPTILTVVDLTQNMSNSQTSMYVASTDEPPFPKTGYLKIDNEIIKYNDKNSNQFLSLERGQFATTPATHTANTKVREVRYFDVQFDKAPAYNIKSPFITGILFEDPAQIEIHKAEFGAYGGELIIAASNNIASGEYVFAEGTNPLTNKVAFTSIAGIPVVTTEQNDQVKEQKAALDVNIRRYGLKDLVIENPYIVDAVHAQKIADFIISKMAEPVPILNVQTMALPKIQLGDRIRISSLSSFDIINADYWVVSHSLGFGDTLTHTLTLRKVV